ncbi:MAG: flagellar basal body P-ring protein FlgI [Gemmataceae bacterium]|nr:flagellar basal body P-ring protein FlgI [Gemmataceae bacterium]
MRIFSTAIALFATMALLAPRVDAGVRVKDLADLQGSTTNQLVGVGLVVGLDGTGGKATATQQMAVDMLQRFKISTKIIANAQGDAVFKSQNISMVMVTADLGPFHRRGGKVDVTVSALDDATSLNNGVLLRTPLKGFDGIEYLIASGPVSTGGFAFAANSGGASTATAQKNHPTVGRIQGGGDVVREARGEILCQGQVRLMLRDPDYATAKSIARGINERFGPIGFAIDAGTVQVVVPLHEMPNLVGFVGDIGKIEIEPESPARVVINERTGTIVAGHNVRLTPAVVTHGNLAITTTNEPIASQPAPFGRGKTVVLPRGSIGVTEQGGQVRVIDRPTMTVNDLANALNALGASPRDLIVILQALKQAGALHAEIVKM